VGGNSVRAVAASTDQGGGRRPSQEGHATTGETSGGLGALEWCAYYGDVSAMRFLLEANDVNGDSPLSWASWYQRPDAVLRKLCHGKYSIRPDGKSMQAYLLGWPHGEA